MWSTLINCLCVLIAKTYKICDFVYFKRTKFQLFIICNLFFFITTDRCFAQEIASNGSIKERRSTNHSKSLLINVKDIKIHPFYNENSHINLNLSWPFEAENIKYEIQLTSYTSKQCPGTHTSPVYTFFDHKNVIVPDISFLIKNQCTYKISIRNNSTGNNEAIIKNYTIPSTSHVSNLSVTAFSQIKGETEIVKLNITWINPTEDILPQNYDIKVTPFDSKSAHCKEKGARAFTYDGLNPSMNHFILPTDRDILANKRIIPGCLYKTEIESGPFDESPEVFNFTVDDCVGNICSCRYDNYLPQPTILNIKQFDQKFKIIWIINSTNFEWKKYFNLTSIILRVSGEHDWKKIKTETITNSIINKKQTSYIDIPERISGAFYEMKISIKSTQNCESRFSYRKFQARFVEEPHWMYQFLFPIMFIIMFITFLWVLWRKKCCWCLKNILHINQHSPPQQIRRIYRPSTDAYRGRPLLAIEMDYNILYKEREILDELERGKVDKYEISYNRLQIGKYIGGGAFGQVFIAKAAGINGIPGYSTVAVKMLKKTASAEELEEFQLEIAMLKQINRHPNIVTLLGCCTMRQPYCMIMEYVPCGDLLHYLRALRVQYQQKGKAFLFTVNKNFDASPALDKQTISECSYIIPESIPSNRLPSVTETEYTVISSEMMDLPHTPNSPIPPGTPHTPAVLECVLDPKELQSFAVQIARGMEYLERKQIIHRDLAARNVLIDENKILKISDFGMSRRGIYVNSKHKKVPLRWVSVEAIRYNLYTSKSDVWSYGIVLWEIGTLGGFPYSSLQDREILSFLLEGKRLEKPENCTKELYELMHLCWADKEDQRPSFQELLEHLEAISNKRRVYIDFSQLNPSYVFPPTEQQNMTQSSTEDNNVKVIEMVICDR